MAMKMHKITPQTMTLYETRIFLIHVLFRITKKSKLNSLYCHVAKTTVANSKKTIENFFIFSLIRALLLSAKIQRISQIIVTNPTILYKLVGLMYEMKKTNILLLLVTLFLYLHLFQEEGFLGVED